MMERLSRHGEESVSDIDAEAERLLDDMLSDLLALEEDGERGLNTVDLERAYQASRRALLVYASNKRAGSRNDPGNAVT